MFSFNPYFYLEQGEMYNLLDLVLTLGLLFITVALGYLAPLTIGLSHEALLSIV